ncbi:MAG: tRNA (adenosine(37)-N6)-dimethylallyltransferase MiaA [Candidatus Thermoplasmatota archaeon]|nr:tRNA (adenosine(37)-N6)-dimethylallyltransferase MiaA [Candidatus Thermoplasmatota archaeon]
MLLIIAGPTAVGKTETAEYIARKIGGEMISADSGTRYRRTVIGTGRAFLAKDVPYHAIDYLDPRHYSSSHEWVIRARKAVDDIISRGRTPIICGGTMHFIELFMNGMDPSPPPDQDMRASLRDIERRTGPGALHSLLETLDPETASKVHPNDIGRTIRYIERALGGHENRKVPPYRGDHRSFFLIRDRETLNRLIRERTEKMMQIGWVEEVQMLLDEGYTGEAPGFMSTGYRHVLSIIREGVSEEKATERINRDTINLSRKQMRWRGRLRAGLMPDDGAGGDGTPEERILQLLDKE